MRTPQRPTEALLLHAHYTSQRSGHTLSLGVAQHSNLHHTSTGTMLAQDETEVEHDLHVIRGSRVKQQSLSCGAGEHHRLHRTHIGTVAAADESGERVRHKRVQPSTKGRMKNKHERKTNLVITSVSLWVKPSSSNSEIALLHSEALTRFTFVLQHPQHKPFDLCCENQIATKACSTGLATASLLCTYRKQMMSFCGR